MLPLDQAGSSQALTPLQAAALLTSRRALSPLEGTRLVRELDLLLRQLAHGPRATNRVHVPRALAFAPDRLSTIDRALDQRRCLRLRYRGVRDERPSWRVVEPMELRVSGEHPYLVAYDRAAEAYKTYKLARVTHVQMLDERTRADETYRADELFQHSRGIWSGPAQVVEVRLRGEVARFAVEWPLEPSQSITDAGDGDIVIRARVAGLHEPLRWVLRWGRHAEVIAPAELRAMVVGELASALGVYRKSRRAKRGVSNRETGVA
ncbi:MAG TPA: WYL domain-containing protein [Polyangiales bacterium]|nr:WYL domain-containing protein [Polyangiales bacterium]